MLNLEPYRTPRGYFDLPYIFVYDGDTLTDGVNYANIFVGVADDRAGFALRQVMGRDKLAARIQLRDSFAPFTGADAGIVMPLTYPIAPERFITPVGSLNMDLFNVLRANRLDGQVPIYFAQIAFQGVRRYQGDSLYPGGSDYQYRERPFTYSQTVTVNWPGADTQPRKYSIAITEGCDFELQRITIVRTSLGDGQGGQVATNVTPNSEIKLQLFEQYGKQLSNAPVLDVYLNDAVVGGVGAYNGLFPVPGVLYKRMSFIHYEVTSLLTVAMLNGVYEINFHGVRRVQQ